MASHQWRFTRLFSLSLSLSASLSLSLCLSPSRETISSNLPLNFRRPCRPYARETNSTNARWKEQRRGGGDRGWGEGAGGGEGRGGETRAGSRVSTSLSKQSTCLVTWTRRILFVPFLRLILREAEKLLCSSGSRAGQECKASQCSRLRLDRRVGRMCLERNYFFINFSLSKWREKQEYSRNED